MRGCQHLNARTGRAASASLFDAQRLSESPLAGDLRKFAGGALHFVRRFHLIPLFRCAEAEDAGNRPRAVTESQGSALREALWYL